MVIFIAKRSDTILIYSSKLFNYLDHNFFEQNDVLEGVPANDETGVFYDFESEPHIVLFEQVKN